MNDSGPMPNTSKPPRFYSVQAAARILGISTMTLYREIAGGYFPAIRIRNRLIIPAKVVDEMAETAISSQSAVDARDWATRDREH